MRRELDAISDERERQQAFENMVALAYQRGRGLNMAAYGEIDDVIDPADSRRWISTLFDDPPPHWRASPGKRRPFVDAW
jgi:acetyl-CoA carboxylase carboxyltransferase component